MWSCFFFFQAEDGIRDSPVTGVQTCALPICKELRFNNEPVRHKALDLIGDLALLGMPLQGHIIASKSGHAANVELVKKIKKVYEKKILQRRFQKNLNSDFMFDINSILNLLPRSEEHTSELQSLVNLVCRLLLEKKKHRPK